MGFRRNFGLDVLRSIAILQVVIVHSTYVFPEHIKTFLQLLIPSIDGVSIFFVLSGFLIGDILLNTFDKSSFDLTDLFQFWIRRWFRTLPNYFLVLTLLILYDVFIYRIQSQFSLSYIIFAQNFLTNHPDFFPEAWSLSIEEWFYLLFPICCFIGFRLSKKKHRMFLIIVLSFLIIPFLLRLGAFVNDFSHSISIRKVLVYRLDSIMFGIVGAYIFRHHPNIWFKTSSPGVWVSGFIIVFLTYFSIAHPDNTIFWQIYSFSLESISVLLALPFFYQVSSHRFGRISGFFTFVSLVSYSMYILNLSVVQWRIVPGFLSMFNLTHFDMESAGIVSFVLFWIFLFVGSYLLYRFYELPMTNLRDRFKFIRR